MNTSPPVRLFIEETAAGTFSKVTLGNYKGSDSTLKSVIIRPVTIRQKQSLSFTYRHKTRDIVKNHPYDKGLDVISGMLATDFGAATLFREDVDIILETLKDGKQRIRRENPTHKTLADTQHNRDKKRKVETKNKEYLHALGITDADGNVRATSQDKFRQIDKYIEILDGMIRSLAERKQWRIADMGSGKGYLTFALYDHITGKLDKQASITGVEYRADLVELCNKIAKKCGYAHLDFIKGGIADFEADHLDILIALHACDTATDDALFKGITAKADLIVTAPCCHKQVRRDMKDAAAPLETLLRHGIFRERQAEMLTDGLRARILEYFGYDVKVFEFISDAHTAKNIMITAVRNPKKKLRNAEILNDIAAIKKHFGLKTHYLEGLCGIA